MMIEELDLDEKTILIHGKGKKKRILYISSNDVMDIINLWLEHRKALNPKSNLFFISKYGTQLSLGAIEEIFYKYRDLSGINSNATPHYLRHSFATQLLKMEQIFEVFKNYWDILEFLQQKFTRRFMSNIKKGFTQL